MTRASIAPLLVLTAVLVAAPTAQAVNCDTTTLTDADGVVWGFTSAGPVDPSKDGLDNAGGAYFDRDTNPGYPFHSDECLLESGGRELAFPEKAVVGLQVSGKIFVPDDEPAFVRHVWFMRNAGGSEVSVSFFRGIAVANDYATSDVRTSSSGDESVTTADDWFVWNNSADATDPATVTIWQGALAGRRIDVAEIFSPCCEPPPGNPIVDGFEEPMIGYENLVVPPGETRALMQIDLFRQDEAAAVAAADALTAFPAAARVGLSPTEIAQIQNYAPDPDADGVEEGDNCPADANADQADLDGDGQGDACDPDDDGDGLSDAVEIEFGTNPRGADSDGDAVADKQDPCPTVAGTAGGCPPGAAGGSTPPLTAPQPVVFLGRLDPGSTAATLRRRGRRFTVSGSVLPPEGLSAQQACAAAGFVELRARRGRRTAGRRRARLQPDCTYAVSLRPRARKGQSVRLTVRWLGNKFLEPATVRTFTRRVG